MTTRRFALVLALIVFGTTGFTCSQQVAETPLQKLYALKADYRAALTIAVGYRVQCEAKAVELRAGCDDHVRKLQVLDNQVFAAVGQAETAAKAGQSLELASANAILSAAIAHLNAYILQNHLEGGPQAWVQEPLSLS